MVEFLGQVGILLAIYVGLWLADTLMALRNNINKGERFEWGRLWSGVLKALIGGFGLVIGATAIYALPFALATAGISIEPQAAEIISSAGVLAVIGFGIVQYAIKYKDGISELFGKGKK